MKRLPICHCTCRYSFSFNAGVFDVRNTQHLRKLGVMKQSLKSLKYINEDWKQVTFLIVIVIQAVRLYFEYNFLVRINTKIIFNFYRQKSMILMQRCFCNEKEDGRNKILSCICRVGIIRCLMQSSCAVALEVNTALITTKDEGRVRREGKCRKERLCSCSCVSS